MSLIEVAVIPGWTRDPWRSTGVREAWIAGQARNDNLLGGH